MYQQEIQIRVRYAETDQMGYVYYGNYATYYEVARVEALRKVGFSYKQLEDSGIGMPVLDLNIRYFRPAKYDDLLTIKLTVPEMPSTKIKFVYEVSNQDDILINKAETTLVFIKLETGKPIKLPTELGRLFSPYYD